MSKSLSDVISRYDDYIRSIHLYHKTSKRL